MGNTALREVLEHRPSALAVTRLRDATDSGAFDLALLTERRTTDGDRFRRRGIVT
jgi:hypothetical protein